MPSPSSRRTWTETGTLDVLSASYYDNKIAWYENQGGQFALATTDTAPAVLLQGDTSDLFEIVMTHRGIAGDRDEELATLELQFEESSGDPLSTDDANALIESLAVYRDTGSGVFEAGSDTLVTSVSMPNGTQTLTLPDGHAGAQVAHGTPGTFFAVVTLTSDAQAHTINRFVLTHVTEAGSTAEDRDHDIPLALEYVADLASRTVLAASPSSDADSDGLLDLYEMDTGVYVSPTDAGSDPLDSDTDDDGLTDGDEANTHSTDPVDSDTDDDGLDDGEEIALGTSPTDPDEDDDGVCDGGNTVGGICDTAGPDNCPFIGNEGQTNSDALPAGDVCQCGDLDSDGPVEADDVLLARQHLMGITVTADLTRCNVTGPSDGGVTDCDVADIFVLQRVVAGRPVTVENTCQAYTGP